MGLKDAAAERLEENHYLPLGAGPAATGGRRPVKTEAQPVRWRCAVHHARLRLLGFRLDVNIEAELRCHPSISGD